jgi:Uma2 family endonuclease
MKMDATTGEEVTLFDVPPDMYEDLRRALPDEPLRYSARREELRIPTELHDIGWNSYEAVLRALGDHSVRHIYDCGTLEIIMSPLEEHDWLSKFLGRMIETLLFLLDLDLKCVGTTTQRRKRIKKGAQPDQAYYIANEPKVRGRRKRDTAFDPPPDLMVEVDITRNSLKRMPIYAAMRVPEVWRYDGKALYFYGLGKDGQYVQIEYSLAFPFVRSSDLQRFIGELDDDTERIVFKKFLAWARRKVRAYRNK